MDNGISKDPDINVDTVKFLFFENFMKIKTVTILSLCNIVTAILSYSIVVSSKSLFF